jgi:FkbM family methyltransferase
MKIFIDIGAHIGQTLHEVSKEKYAFDKIVCFEPSSLCWDELKKIALEDDRIEICEFGLSNKNQDIELFMPGTQFCQKHISPLILRVAFVQYVRLYL